VPSSDLRARRLTPELRSHHQIVPGCDVERSNRHPLARGHHLLPHERRSAESWLRSQAANRTAGVLQFEQNYGPSGIALIAAGFASIWPAVTIASIRFFAVLAASNDSLFRLGYTLICVGMVLSLPGFFRLRQAAKSGRTFRDGRPLLKPPGR
jgi:hypothetical protein